MKLSPDAVRTLLISVLPSEFIDDCARECGVLERDRDIDVDVVVGFKRREYDDQRSTDTKQFRVVGVRNQDTDEYHLYMTNLPRETFSAAQIATLYRARWEVELLFRELKSRYGLEKFDTSKPHIVICIRKPNNPLPAEQRC